MKTLKHSRKRKGEFVSYTLFMVSDMSAIVSAYILAYVTRFYYFHDFLSAELPSLERYLYALPVVVFVCIASFQQRRIYVFDVLRRRLDEIALLGKSILVAAVAIMSLAFLYRDFSYSRTFLFIHCVYSFFFVCLFRHVAYMADGLLRSLMKTKIRVLLVGGNRNSRQIIRRINRSYRNRYEVIGVLSGGKMSDEKHFEGVPILGDLDDLQGIIDKSIPDEIILTVPDYPDQKLSELFLRCENDMITFLKIPDLFGIVTSGVTIHYIDHVPLIGLKRSPLDRMSSRVLKRMLDIVGSLAGLMILMPLMVIIGVVVKLTDGGGVFYRQARVGMDGRSFMILKFRTMRMDAERDTGPVWARESDQRTTRIGKFLRRYNLDEIPQLWNVLVGQMSLVGPRPERPHFVGQFREAVPRYMSRHKIKSGITGWAQVNGLRGNTSITERTKYDLYYYENWSLFLDMKILFLTFTAFKNAY